MMGHPVTEDLYSIFSKEKEHEEKEKESQRGAQEQVSLLLQTYMQMLLPDDEKFHGGWALIDCDPRWEPSTSSCSVFRRVLIPSQLYDAVSEKEAVLGGCTHRMHFCIQIHKTLLVKNVSLT